MPCARCTPLLTAKTSERDRSELNGVFAIVEETAEKYDSATMWWHGKARCLSCSQLMSFEYRSDSQNFGCLTLEG